MQYNFKAVPELLFFAVVSAAVYLLSEYLTTNEATDWRVWIVAAGGGASRVAAAALIAGFTKLWLTARGE